MSAPANGIGGPRPATGTRMAPLATIVAYGSIHQTVRFDPIMVSGRVLASRIVRIAAALPRIRVRRIIFAVRTI
ncbi:hypothetical protein [Sphingomonas sp. OK281]|uniref:hypothetical protein n=1 Tax=Sphingomonas sp. OK281 TaxID=1881067 RepID=UPI0008E8572E|nr:hypothetical protein [Sphingomonas sp. OK281]SFO03531.1 hypothetical protein SAMN05428984_1761 [Sphingomonas sp. OK281]